MSSALARSLAEHGFEGARVAVVLGSGLGGFAERLEGAHAVPFADLAGMPASSVPGHAGAFRIGSIAGVRTIVQAGRVHLYEGRSGAEVGASVRAFAALGVRALVLTNAAGSLRGDWRPPLLMRITDHIDRQGGTPLGLGEGGRGSPYDPELGSVFDGAAAEAGVALARGVYAGVLGPAYETPAEVAMLRWTGADAVGMSTVREAQAARVAGLRVAAVSCVTNLAAGLAPHGLSHADVVRAGADLTERLAALLARAIPRMAAASGVAR